ncbi:hypothetical protein EG328_000247 [Venturia inaequalis]|uniref:CCHC-type domain-containing protein n=1 Tax=Venturia inaequalis TaxID=5025 RepID=A0A8H3V3S8_VENIN|nr:hypothetical protein EG328_000247 [Venturia inaequalis]
MALWVLGSLALLPQSRRGEAVPSRQSASEQRVMSISEDCHDYYNQDDHVYPTAPHEVSSPPSRWKSEALPADSISYHSFSEEVLELHKIPLTMSRDCTQGAKCYNCGELGHISKDCPSEMSQKHSTKLLKDTIGATTLIYHHQQRSMTSARRLNFATARTYQLEDTLWLSAQSGVQLQLLTSDQRVSTENGRFGRYPPLPRVDPNDDSVAWHLKSHLRSHPSDEPWLVPTMEDIYCPVEA